MKCPVCNKELEEVDTEHNINIFHCPRCDTYRTIDEKDNLILMRRSPGINWYSLCIGSQLAGKCFKTKEQARIAFEEASDFCKKNKKFFKNL